MDAKSFMGPDGLGGKDRKHEAMLQPGHLSRGSGEGHTSSTFHSSWRSRREATENPCMDTQLVEHLNSWFTANAFRVDLSRALAIVPLVLIGALVVLAWSTPRSNAPIGRSELVLGGVAAVGALLLNLALGH